jgi:DEAD/DEAH box helicase domain-containing protein
MNKPRIQYFDLETQLIADAVGGWNNAHLMKIAVSVLWDSVDEDYFVYRESETQDLFRKMESADLVIGFNTINFDYKVLSPYPTFSLDKIRTFDILKDVNKILNHRLSLNALAECNLGKKKSADGLQSIEWFKQGKMDEIIEYCKQDVACTRDLFLYGQKNGVLKYKTKYGTEKQFKVDWRF